MDLKKGENLDDIRKNLRESGNYFKKAIDATKDDEIKQLKQRNRRLIFSNTALTIGITAIAFSTIYFTLL